MNFSEAYNTTLEKLAEHDTFLLLNLPFLALFFSLSFILYAQNPYEKSVWER